MQDAPFGVIRGAYAIRPYSLPAGDAFSYGQGRVIGKRFQNKYPQKMEIPLPRPGKLAGYGIGLKRDGERIAGGRSRPSLDKNLEGVAEG